MRLQVKMSNRKIIDRFKILSKTEIGKSFLIRFDYDLATELLTIEYEIKRTIWDKKEKDYCIDLFMFDRSNSYLYIYPQANEVYIPFIDARKYFNILVKEVFNIDIGITKKAIDRLFQTLKLTINREERLEYIRECIESSIELTSRTKLGRLLNRNIESKLINISELDCRILEYRFTQNLINFIEITNLIISSIDRKEIEEGLFSSNILIHEGLSKIFKTELWNKIKNIFGGYDKEFILSGSISGLIPEFSTNMLFLPVVQNYLDLYILDLEELDRRYFELANQSKVRYVGEMDYCIKDSDMFYSLIKVLNLVDILSDYEANIFQVIPNLSQEELNNPEILKYFSYKNNQLLTLAEFNKVKKFYNDSNKLIDNILSKSDDFIDSNLFILPRKVSDLMVTIFNKYFI